MSIGLNSENSISIGLISSEKPKINRLSSENSIGFGFGSSENSMNAMQCLPSTSKPAQYKSSFSNTFLNSSENSCFTDNTSSSVQSMPGMGNRKCKWTYRGQMFLLSEATLHLGPVRQ